MKVIFGTTNKRKVQDFQNLIKRFNMDVEVLSMDDINWDRGEIEEDGSTIAENSLIKANAIHDFCVDHGINYPIITDDTGLFVEVLGDEPGVYTARYAEEEIKNDPSLPKYYSIYKLLNKLKDVDNRNASYICCVTCMLSDGTYFQEYGESKGTITNDVMSEIKKPYFYAIFMLNGKIYSEYTDEEVIDTYRCVALKNTLSKLNKN